MRRDDLKIERIVADDSKRKRTLQSQVNINIFSDKSIKIKKLLTID